MAIEISARESNPSLQHRQHSVNYLGLYADAHLQEESQHLGLPIARGQRGCAVAFKSEAKTADN